MKIAFFSNFLNHHQLPLCEAFYNTEGIEFKFVACERIPEDRLKMGYEDMNEKYPFVLRAYEDFEAAERVAVAFSFSAIPSATPIANKRGRLSKITVPTDASSEKIV